MTARHKKRNSIVTIGYKIKLITSGSLSVAVQSCHEDMPASGKWQMEM